MKRTALLILLACLDAVPSSAASGPQLVNGGFETNQGSGTIPTGWEAWDEGDGHPRWIAFRAHRSLGGITPFSGQWMAAMDTMQMGVNTNEADRIVTGPDGKEHELPEARAALFQTLRVPRGTKGEFRLRFNDIGSTSGAWVSTIRLGVTIGTRDIEQLTASPLRTAPFTWSGPFRQVAEVNGGTGDWMVARIPFEIPPGEGTAEATFWVGMFDNTNGTEIGYWRIDAAEVIWE